MVNYLFQYVRELNLHEDENSYLSPNNLSSKSSPSAISPLHFSIYINVCSNPHCINLCTEIIHQNNYWIAARMLKGVVDIKNKTTEIY